MPKWTHVSKKSGRKLSARFAPRPLEVREWTKADDWLVIFLQIGATFSGALRPLQDILIDWYTKEEGFFVELKKRR